MTSGACDSNVQYSTTLPDDSALALLILPNRDSKLGGGSEIYIDDVRMYWLTTGP